ASRCLPRAATARARHARARSAAGRVDCAAGRRRSSPDQYPEPPAEPRTGRDACSTPPGTVSAPTPGLAPPPGPFPTSHCPPEKRRLAGERHWGAVKGILLGTATRSSAHFESLA